MSVREVFDYFGGGRVVRVDKGSYAESVAVPKAERDVVAAAILVAVRQGLLWLTSGPASVLGEEIPEGLLTDDARLQAPPAPIPATAILPEQLIGPWKDKTTTALVLYVALSKKAGRSLPWNTVRQGIVEAQRARLVELAVDSGPWPCDYPSAGAVKIQLTAVPPPPPPDGVLVAEATLQPNEIQDLAENVPEIRKATAGLNVSFHLRVEVRAKPRPSPEVIDLINRLLKEVKKDLELR